MNKFGYYSVLLLLLSSCANTNKGRDGTDNTDSAKHELHTGTEMLPFVGERHFETRPGISGTGTPSRQVEIKENGIVIFSFVQVNQADKKTVTKGNYNAGHFKKIMKCFFKEYSNETSFYEITSNWIYETDSNGVRLKSGDCCRSILDSMCSCESEYFENIK